MLIEAPTLSSDDLSALSRILHDDLPTHLEALVDLAGNHGGHIRISFPLAGTLTLRLTLEPDYDTELSDFDCYGKVQWISRFDSDRIRPDTFDGNAEKVDASQHGVFWWQPPAGIPRTDPNFPALRRNVRDLAVFGFHVVVLTATHTRTDGYSRTGTACLGGVESLGGTDYLTELAGDYLTELAGDLLDDALADLDAV